MEAAKDMKMDYFIEGFNLIDPSKITDDNPSTVLQCLDLLSYQYELKELEDNKELNKLYTKFVKSAKST